MKKAWMLAAALSFACGGAATNSANADNLDTVSVQGAHEPPMLGVHWAKGQKGGGGGSPDMTGRRQRDADRIHRGHLLGHQLERVHRRQDHRHRRLVLGLRRLELRRHLERVRRRRRLRHPRRGRSHVANPVTNGYSAVYVDTPRGHAGSCAWHSWGQCNGVNVQFAFFFNLDGDAGCDPQDTTTSHSQGLAALANVSGHELSEARTDPRGDGWFDSGGAENGDKCAWSFGAPLVSFSNGTQWKIQGEWSNAAYTANTGYPNRSGQNGCLAGNSPSGLALRRRSRPVRGRLFFLRIPPDKRPMLPVFRTCKARPMRLAIALSVLSAACASQPSPSAQASALQSGSIRTVFLIMMENHSWAQIKGSSSAPYLNGLLAQGAHAEAYRNPGYLHPSLPNYLWLEAGTNFGILADGDPGTYHQATSQHFVTLLDAQGFGWKSYLEDIDGKSCPLSASGKYAPRHNGPLFFDDVTDGNSSTSANCIAHVRPYSELATDLANGTVPSFAYITPNLCDDMHDTVGCGSLDSVKNGDDWLSREVPKILASSQFQSGGALFITWDESEASEAPMGMIVLSPFARAGYASTVALTHSSTLRTFQEIFGLSPFLGGAANAADLSDLFQTSLAIKCTSDAQCGSGQVCSSGTCQASPPAGSCQSDADCTGGLACVVGSCQARPSSSCPPGTTDIGGNCVPTGCSSTGGGWLAALALLAAAASPETLHRASRSRRHSRDAPVAQVDRAPVS